MSYLKRITRRGTVMALTALMLAAAGVQARPLSEIKASNKLIIGTEGLYAPFNFFQGSTLSGFEIDLGNAIAAKLGVKVEWKTTKFDYLLPGLRQNRWDLVMASFGVTAERAKSVLFSDPHYCSVGLIVSKDKTIRTSAQLTGKIVAVQEGTTYEEQAKKNKGIKEVRGFPEDADARVAVQNDQADAYVGDRFAIIAALKLPAAAALKMGEAMFVEKVATAMKPDDRTLELAYNKALKDLMADGTYKKISEKYFNEDIRCK